MTVTRSTIPNNISEDSRKEFYALRSKSTEKEALQFLLSLTVNEDEKEKIRENENLIPMIIGRARGILYKTGINSCYPQGVGTDKGCVYCFEREPYEDRCAYCTISERLKENDI